MFPIFFVRCCCGLVVELQPKFVAPLPLGYFGTFDFAILRGPWLLQ